MTETNFPVARWLEDGVEHAVRWRSEAALPPPECIVPGDDTMTADAAYRLAVQGTAILWRGDYQNARNLLQALARRADRKPREGATKKPLTLAEAFEQHRQNQGRRAAILASVLVPLRADYSIALRRGQDVRDACRAALGPESVDSLISLRGLLALVSAWEWRKKGALVPALGARIHPHFGVFSPVRGEYVDLAGQSATTGWVSAGLRYWYRLRRSGLRACPSRHCAGCRHRHG